MRLTACPSNSRGAPGSSRGNHGLSLDTRVSTLFVHAGPRRSCHSRDRVAVPSGHGQSSPHRGGCRAPAGSYLRQTSFPRPVRSAKERQLSCVSWSALLSILGCCCPDLLCANPLPGPKLRGVHSPYLFSTATIRTHRASPSLGQPCENGPAR